MSLDIESLLRVAAIEKATGKSKEIVIQHALEPKTMEQIAAARERVRRLFEGHRWEGLSMRPQRERPPPQIRRWTLGYQRSSRWPNARMQEGKRLKGTYPDAPPVHPSTGTHQGSSRCHTWEPVVAFPPTLMGA